MMGEVPPTTVSPERCPVCGYGLETVHKTGRLGCAVCYEKFFPYLEEALRESQKAVTHTGKRPGRKNARPEDLEAEMKQLIRTEQYEEAAKVRDRLAKCKPPTKKERPA